MRLLARAGGALSRIGDRMMRTDEAVLWPSVHDVARRAKYKRGKQLFDGDHMALFEPQRQVQSKGPYVVCNALRAATRAIADRMVLELPVATVGEDDAVNDALTEIAQDSMMGRLLLRSLRGWSYRGDLVYRATEQENPTTGETDTVIREVPPGQFFPHYATDDHDRMEAASITWQHPMLQQGQSADNPSAWWQREEFHTPGKIENRLYILRRPEGMEGR